METAKLANVGQMDKENMMCMYQVYIEYYSANIKKGILLFMTWLKLEGITVSGKKESET